jgi:hypothetical protein
MREKSKIRFDNKPNEKKSQFFLMDPGPKTFAPRSQPSQVEPQKSLVHLLAVDADVSERVAARAMVQELLSQGQVAAAVLEDVIAEGFAQAVDPNVGQLEGFPGPGQC